MQDNRELFKFKQFEVNQAGCAMKINTDGVLIAAMSKHDVPNKILDIGTGTGLLALMVAQRNLNAGIDAVELDQDAFSQAVDNVKDSPFFDKINLINSSIQDFSLTYQYDCIITNPPFFQSGLLSPKAKKNQAHHATSLSFDELLYSLNRLVAADGRFNILLPVDEAAIFSAKALESEWFLARKLTLYHDKNKNPFRQLMTFKRKHLTENQTFDEKLFIYEEDGKRYDSRFKQLMKDFYLIF